MLGLRYGEKEGQFTLTPAAQNFQSSKLSGLSDLVKVYVQANSVLCRLIEIVRIRFHCARLRAGSPSISS